MVERIRGRALPRLKQENQSNSIFDSKEGSHLSSAIEELSNNIILLKNKAKTEKEVAQLLSNLNSNFIDVDTLDSSTFTESISELHKDLLEMQSQTSVFIESSLESNKYLSKMDKRDYESSLLQAKSVEELNKIKSEITNQSVDSQFLIKTMSAVRNGLEESSSISNDQSKVFYKEIDKIGLKFNKTGEVNNAALIDLVTKVSNLTDGDGNKAVRIDSERQVLKAVEARVLKNVITAAKQSGDNELTKVSLSVTQLGNHLGSVMEELSDSQKLKLESLTESFGKNQISLEEHTSAVRNIIGKGRKLDEDTLMQLSKLRTHLNVIQTNTDPKTDKLSNAEKILKQNEQELNQETNENLKSLLGNIATKENVAVSSSVLEGVSSAEDLGETLTDRLFEAAGSKILGRKGRRGRGRGVASLLGKGGLSGLTSAARLGGSGLLSGAMKAAGPLAAIASTGMSAFDFFNSDDEAGRNKALGSGLGGLIGGGIGVLGGPLGIAAGAALGNWVGGKVGSWFSDSSDFIPDEIKEKGKEAELRYIDEILEPAIKAEMVSATGKYNAEDLANLQKYRKSLSSSIKANSKAAMDGLTPDEETQLSSLIEQGMTSPSQLSISTGIPLSKVNKKLQGVNQYQPTTATFNKGSNQSEGGKNSSGSTNVQIVQNSGGNSRGRPRITDESITLLAHMI